MAPIELKNLRKSLGLTQVELAELLGVEKTSVWRWEKGQQVISQAVAMAAEHLRCKLKSRPRATHGKPA